MKMRLIAGCIAGALMMASVTPALAQADSKYTIGPLWYMTAVQVEDGQFENYMDFLADRFKKSHEFGIKEGVELAYHVLSVNEKRAGEPDLYLVWTSKDYLTVPEQLAFEAKINKFLNEDRRTGEAGAAKRLPMRKIIGDMELRELVLK